MTTREDMIETAARALCESDGFDWPYCNSARAHRADASVVLDAVLPQITTVEQLEALPSRSMLVDCDGEPAVKVKRLTVIDDAGMGMAWTVEEFAEVCLPATVVWQPAQPEADR